MIKILRHNAILPWNIPFLYQNQAYHATPTLFKRRSGNSGLDIKPRPFSKKQKKRHSRFVERMRAKVDPVKKKLKLNQVVSKWESPKTQEYIESVRAM